MRRRLDSAPFKLFYELLNVHLFFSILSLLPESKFYENERLKLMIKEKTTKASQNSLQHMNLFIIQMAHNEYQ